MVEYNSNLNLVFSSLSNSTRRDILRRVSMNELSIGELAQVYDMSFEAVSKHVRVLEKASLVSKRRRGKYYFIHLSPKPFKDAMDYLTFYKQFWDDKLDALGRYLEKEE